ncbi:IclR family transcriptional regulator [Actinoallomurus sp. NBC_01490]|jgi:DNA-binding IclR family transcriptional regulator|uniref:IclR family transcriptional regulator n=1 Tax=Actinoallomurus sp. NBC_01490 TaxID=2903557 RepID=UPI002E32CE3F|nr:IclR family transcriptional regulator [Actinoallomurus sp. NBC_01490]
MGNPSPSGLSSVDNALRLLRLIGERKVLRVAEAAELLGVARSTAHRLLSALRHHGFVLQDRPNGAYRPGPVLNEIGLSAIGRIDIRRVAHPVLEELRDQTGETTSLSLLEGRDVRFIDCVESPRTVRVGDRTGVVIPAHCTAGGKAILAALSLTELSRRYAGQDLSARTIASVVSWEALQRELEEIGRTGYAINMEEGETGICAVAAALRDLTGAPLAAVAVVVPASRMPDLGTAHSLAPLVTEAAKTIEERLLAEL